VYVVSYVTQPAEFDRYADLRQRYFGTPQPPWSATVTMPHLLDPDYLVQVEAFAVRSSNATDSGHLKRGRTLAKVFYAWPPLSVDARLRAKTGLARC